jgi:hypothetical protein
MKITFKKIYFFGGDTKLDSDELEDYVAAYEASNGKRIDVIYSTYTTKYYEVDGKYFETLKEAKMFCAA